jgi:HTH-type transcriptional regulator/antitoxin HigA
MNMMVKTAITHWPQVAPLLTPPRSKAEHARLVQALDAVLDAGGADEKHPLARLADYLGDLVEGYETARLPKKEIPVTDFLKQLMKAQGLNQSELPEIGSQGVVSEVLKGRRQLNVRQIARLAQRFKLPADVFMS